MYTISKPPTPAFTVSYPYLYSAPGYGYRSLGDASVSMCYKCVGGWSPGYTNANPVPLCTPCPTGYTYDYPSVTPSSADVYLHV